ncbi:prepilin-type N-terminal cleavage/methylation domain-containing protein [Paraglaciecola aquimarina]|uniref:Prepilin-type N-terminal cleavage/methylation domain-containing protein n=1 Tax=Paraglaciecola algarum TaxID=3050085 RepID=A0ABS9D5R3_9ALTE|nr:prepilin-type N-terminal cleavage/methylation domain-containing protein [Paraglaciecola sp. G1-23]MCF2947363.1 prepilin-type N-terminal cleavage/methylation domain-containing protein [Paraglaciecola sp. G1-23]
MFSSNRKKHGFTLIELITVIVILGVVSVGLSGFIRTGMGIYTDVNERDQILGESRFMVERISRELRHAIPNSTRIKSVGNTQCLEFVPTLWVTYYTSLPVLPDTATQSTIIEIGQNKANYQITPQNTLAGVTGDYAFVYPTSNTDIYAAASEKRREILACTEQDASADDDCWTLDDAQHTAILTLDGSFADNSPASRLYFGRDAISYCAYNDGKVYRYQNVIDDIQEVYPSDSTVSRALMAKELTNSQPFKIEEASLTRNGLVNILLEFKRNDELVNYNVEVHIPNVP